MTLTDNEKKALGAWRDLDEYHDLLTFKHVESYSGLDASVIRRTVRALARKGMVKRECGYNEDTGFLCGSGYTPTKAGEEWLRDGKTK